MNTYSELQKFLSPYDAEIQKLVNELREFIGGLVPEANVLIWDNYNAVAIAFSKSERLKDAFCHIAVYTKHVNLGFNRGTELSKSSIELSGKGKLIRHITIKNMKNFPKNAIEKMIWEAVGISEKHTPELVHKTASGKTIVMSISEKKIRPTNN